jgi:hypothetical protein
VAALTNAAEAERLRRNRQADTGSRPAGPILPSEGHVVAEFTFGFWRYLTRSSHEKTLWVPYLHRAFPPGTSRKAVDKHVTKLNDLRNRVAHHEPLDPGNVARRHRDLVELAGWLNVDLGAYVGDTTEVPQLLASEPT